MRDIDLLDISQHRASTQSEVHAPFTVAKYQPTSKRLEAFATSMLVFRLRDSEAITRPEPASGTAGLLPNAEVIGQHFPPVLRPAWRELGGLPQNLV